MAPRIVGGSNYDNPYAHPAGYDPLADKLFEAFDQREREVGETKNDPVAEIMAEFQEAQRRQRDPRPRNGVEL